MQNKRWAFIYNPRSGKARAASLKPILARRLAELGQEAEFWEWSRPELADELARRAIDDGFDVAVAMGGDGTAHAFGTRLMGSATALALLPAGSGNGIARAMGLLPPVPSALDALLKGEFRFMDTGKVNGQHFIGFAGLGLDARVARAFAGVKQRSLAQYVYLTLKNYMNHIPEKVRVHDDVGRVEEWKGLGMLGILNTGQYGYGATFHPGASPFDGQLNLVGLKKIPVWQSPDLMMRLFQGDLTAASYTRQLSGRNLIIERQAPGLIQVDGEPMQAQARLVVELLPASLKVLVPAIPAISAPVVH